MGKIRKYQLGGPGYFMHDATVREAVKHPRRATKKVANAGLGVLGALGQAFTKILTNLPQGNTSVVLPARPELIKRDRQVKKEQERAVEKAMPYLSPSNHVIAWTQGSMDPMVGAQKLAEWGPEAQLAGALTDIASFKYAPKIIKGVPEASLKVASKAGSKKAKTALVARNIDKNVKNTTLSAPVTQEVTLAAPRTKSPLDNQAQPFELSGRIKSRYQTPASGRTNITESIIENFIEDPSDLQNITSVIARANNVPDQVISRYFQANPARIADRGDREAFIRRYAGLNSGDLDRNLRMTIQDYFQDYFNSNPELLSQTEQSFRDSGVWPGFRRHVIVDVAKNMRGAKDINDAIAKTLHQYLSTPDRIFNGNDVMRAFSRSPQAQQFLADFGLSTSDIPKLLRYNRYFDQYVPDFAQYASSIRSYLQDLNTQSPLSALLQMSPENLRNFSDGDLNFWYTSHGRRLHPDIRRGEYTPRAMARAIQAYKDEAMRPDMEYGISETLDGNFSASSSPLILHSARDIIGLRRNAGLYTGRIHPNHRSPYSTSLGNSYGNVNLGTYDNPRIGYAFGYNPSIEEIRSYPTRAKAAATINTKLAQLYQAFMKANPGKYSFNPELLNSVVKAKGDISKVPGAQEAKWPDNRTPLFATFPESSEVPIYPNIVIEFKKGGLVKKYKGGKRVETFEEKMARRAQSYWNKAKSMAKEFTDAGVDALAAMGILGNIGQESAFNPLAKNSINGGHWGYVQNDRNLHGYMVKHFGGWDHTSQMRYLIAGLTGKLPQEGIGKAIQKRFNDYLTSMKGVTDPEMAAYLWEKHYERSNNENIPERKYYAKWFYDEWNKNNRPTGIESIQPIQHIEVPDALKVVKPKVHQVVKGNTLGQIAQQYNTSVDNLARINNIQDTNNIEVGDNLRVDEDIPRIGREDIAYGWYNPTISNPSIDFEDPMLAYQNADYLNYLRNNYI